MGVYSGPERNVSIQTTSGRSLYSLGVVQDGLVLNLDAGKFYSYPQSGTIWTDLSGNGNTGTLTNGPTFDSANGGSLVFDGVDDYVNSSTTISITGNITLSAWVRHSALGDGSQRYITILDEQAVIRKAFDSTSLQFYITTSETIRSITTPNRLSVNTWYYVVGTWNGTIMQLYQNATNIGGNAPKPPAGTISTGNRIYQVSSSDEAMNGNISQVSIYNRALTATEIAQNFNATRSRFGI